MSGFERLTPHEAARLIHLDQQYSGGVHLNVGMYLKEETILSVAEGRTPLETYWRVQALHAAISAEIARLESASNEAVKSGVH